MKISGRERGATLPAFGMAVKLAPMVTILKVGALASVNTFCKLAAVLVITAFIARLGVDVLAGALASVLGMGSVWMVAAATLMAGGWATRGQWHYRHSAQE